jgi:glycyl-tRNA synthetase beta chain
VAEAIFEHYLPRGAEDRLPQTDAGALLGMADRIDQLVGIFGLGKEPTGTADPYGLRRAALGLLRVTLARGYSFDMVEALKYAQKLHGKGDAEKVWHFLLARLEVLLREKAQPDSIQAALHTGVPDVVDLEKRLAALQTVRDQSRAQFEAAAAAFKRIANILSQAQQKGLKPMAFHPDRLKHPSELALVDALNRCKQVMKDDVFERKDYRAAYSALAELSGVLNKFFEDVLVMDPDPALRDNRLALLRSLYELFAPLADFSRLQVEKSS